MDKNKYSFCRLTAIFFALTVFLSCNNSGDIPFPEKELGYSQPVTVPLVFSDTKKLKWDTVKTGGIKSVVKKLDIESLPSTPYDPFGFRPFPKPPLQVSFNFNTLQVNPFSLEKIPSKLLHLRTSLLAAPVLIKAGILTPKNGTSISIIDIGQAQGLPDKIIHCLIKDKNGFLWIGTDKALYRYDGEYMQLFASFPVTGMIEDNDGRIWYINDKNIGVIDPMKGVVSKSDEIHTEFPQLPKMILDSRGQIWISWLRQKGADIVDPKNLTYKNLNDANGLSSSYTWGVYEDNEKNIWITTNKGADIINTKSNKIYNLKRSDGLGSDSLRAITGDDKGNIWIAFQHGGVNKVDVNKGLITTFGKSQGFDNTLTHQLLYDDKGQVWMATDQGLSVLNPEQGMFKYFPQKEGIPEEYVLDLLQDDKQRVWVGTYTSGLSIIEQNGNLVNPVVTKTLSTLLEDSRGRIWVGAGSSNSGIEIQDKEKGVVRQLNKQHGLCDNFIQNFLEVNGTIWIATDGGFDIVNLAHKTIEHTGKKEGLASDTLYGILRDKHANIWLIGPSLGVDMIDSAKNIILHAGLKEGLSEENIVDIKSDQQGKIWIATYTKGVDVIDPQNGTIQNLSEETGLKDTCYRILMPDEYGRMWIGTDKGIYVADTKQGTMTSISTKEGLCNNYITSLVTYKGRVLAGTKNKVSIITPPKTINVSGSAGKQDSVWKIALLAGSEGLVNNGNNWSTNIVTKEGQYLWGDAGITIINGIKEQKDTTLPTFIEGISVMNEPQHFTNHITLNGTDTLWNGDKYYVSGQTPENTSYAHQHGFRWDSVSGPYNMPINLRIPYNQNYLQFQFAQHNWGSKEPTLYSYILEGIDKNWSTPTNKTQTENYLNLPPGKYIFKVSSKDISGKWGTPAGFQFTITPPWYKTWWAYTILALLVIGLLRLYIVYRSRKLQKENKILEEKVKHRTQQLQQSIEDLKSTQSQLIQSEKMASLGELTAGIAHEIQNPLNFVNNFSEVNIELTDELKEELNKISLPSSEKLSIEKLADDIKSNQEKINFHGKRADSIVKGMLQHSRSSNGQKEPTDINALADEYLRLAYHGLRAKDKSFNAAMKTDFDENVGKINIVAQDIGRVILNLITNAFYAVTEKKKQVGTGYEPAVTVSTKKTGNTILVSVKDNGNGIPQKVFDKIFQPFFTTKPAGQGTGLGLSLSYDIVKAHRGELKVETKEGVGTEFKILLPV